MKISTLDLGRLDRGIEFQVQGRTVLVTVFAQTHIGDMPQQADTSGLKRQSSFIFCSKCLVRPYPEPTKAKYTLERFAIVLNSTKQIARIIDDES